MKKILLFIFTFGIIFSLYNVKAFAYSHNDFQYIAIVDTFDRYRVIGSMQHNNFKVNASGSIYFVFNNGYTYPYILTTREFSSINEALYFIENGALSEGELYTYSSSSLITVKGSTSGRAQSDNFYPNFNDYIDSLTPDISQCAFFFEPEPGTDLFSMYCFPQELDDGEVVTVHYNNLNNIGFDITSASVDTLKRCYLTNGNSNDYYNSIEYWLEMIDQIKLENDNIIDFLFTTPIYAIYCNFIENNNNPNYNIFPLTEESWWDDIVNDIGFEDTTLGFIWDWLFGEPDPDYHNVTIDNSPSPTPLPTPIPYRTTLIPDGNGGYEFQYEYEDSNGNTITASAPPEQPIYDGNALITQPVNINISGVPVSEVEGVQSLLNVIGEADQEYKEGFQVIGKSFATLPTKWFMFFGIPAAIILIAGIIKSLLG